LVLPGKVFGENHVDTIEDRIAASNNLAVTYV